MKIAITGSSGFIGTHLTQALNALGHQVIPIRQSDYLGSSLEMLNNKLSTCDAVVNLAGSPIATRWSSKNKHLIYESRIHTTHTLVAAMNRLENKPKVFISTSAIGYYTPDGIHTENSSPDVHSFLAHVTVDWEAEAHKIDDDVRLVILRFGLVLGVDGGIFLQMSNLYKKGIGVRIGRDDTPFSWIHIDDLVAILIQMITNERLQGIYNCVAPHVSDSGDFTDALIKCFKPLIKIRVPSILVRMALLDGADMVLRGQHVVSDKLQQTGFKFKYATLPMAISTLCNVCKVK